MEHHWEMGCVDIPGYTLTCWEAMRESLHCNKPQKQRNCVYQRWLYPSRIIVIVPIRIGLGKLMYGKYFVWYGGHFNSFSLLSEFNHNEWMNVSSLRTPRHMPYVSGRRGEMGDVVHTHTSFYKLMKEPNWAVPSLDHCGSEKGVLPEWWCHIESA